MIASTASAYKFSENVALPTGLGQEKNGFEYAKAVAAKTGVRVPGALKNLEKKPIRYKGVIEVKDMPKAVEESIR